MEVVGFVVEEIGVKLARVVWSRLNVEAGKKRKEDGLEFELLVVLRWGFEVGCLRFSEVILVQNVQNAVFATSDDQSQITQNYWTAGAEILVAPIVPTMIAIGDLAPLDGNAVAV